LFTGMSDIDSSDPFPHLDTYDASGSADGRDGGWLAWIAIFLICALALSLAAVHVPPAVKKFGLFGVAFGLSCGWIAARLRSIFDIGAFSRGASTVIVCLAIGVGQFVMTAEAFRLWARANQHNRPVEPSLLFSLDMINSQKVPDDPKSKQIRNEMRQAISRMIEEQRAVATERQSFTSYLRYRISPLGPAIQLFAAIIWVCEIALGSLAGTWLFRRLTRLDAGSPAAKLDP
jgi:hypothetical protein